MIANTAFLAAVTTFLIVAWLAGELSYLSAYKTALFRLHGMRLGVADSPDLPELVRHLLRAGPRPVPARYGPQAEASGSAARHRGRRDRRAAAPTQTVGATRYVARSRSTVARQRIARETTSTSGAI